MEENITRQIAQLQKEILLLKAALISHKAYIERIVKYLKYESTAKLIRDIHEKGVDIDLWPHD